MELFLNLIWASIAIVASVRFARWSSGQPSRRRLLVGLATLCIVAVLFPIISVTDDLHSDVATLEESSLLVVALPAIPVAHSVTNLPLIGSIAADPIVSCLEGVSLAAAIRPPPSRA